MKSTMRALSVTIDENSQTKLQETELSIPSLEPNTVLVKIRAAGLNPSDVLNAAGNFHETTFPRIPGRDYSGVIVAGPEHLVGQEVFGTSGDTLGFSRDGTHAEYCLVPVDSIALKPSNLTFTQAAIIGVPYTTAALALRRANAKAGDTVLITGSSGAVGAAACQIGNSWGCKVLQAARRPNADVNLVSDPDMKSAIPLSGGKGPDVVVETTGTPSLFGAGLSVLAERGRISYISAPKKGSTEFTFDMKVVYREEKVIVGCNSVLTPLAETANDLKLMTGDFENGVLHVEPEQNLETIDIGHAVEAYDLIKNGSHKKFVIAFQ